MMLESYSIAGISIIQGVPRGSCPLDLHVFCTQRKRIMQPLKARSDGDPVK